MINNGFIFAYKPAGISSAKYLNSVKRALSLKKCGHCGTLDPLAEGLLIIGVGKSTKHAEIFASMDKEYVCDMLLGVNSDTYDITGTMNEVMNLDDVIKFAKENKEKINNTLKDLIGKHQQNIPKYSAAKYKGKPRYNYARAGISIPSKSKEIHIKEVEMLSIEKAVVKFRIVISKGGYVRELCNRIGNKLGTGGVMMKLIRTKVGDYKPRFTLPAEFLNSLLL